MKISEARFIVTDMLKEHGLYSQGWRFKLGRGKKRLGACNYRQKQVSVSRYLIELGTDEEVMDTIIHEIAHALTPHCGHNSLWVEKARSLGHPDPKRLATKLSYKIPHKYAIYCNLHGGIVAKRHRRSNPATLARSYCTKCGTVSVRELVEVELDKTDI